MVIMVITFKVLLFHVETHVFSLCFAFCIMTVHDFDTDQMLGGQITRVEFTFHLRDSFLSCM